MTAKMVLTDYILYSVHKEGLSGYCFQTLFYYVAFIIPVNTNHGLKVLNVSSGGSVWKKHKCFRRNS